MVMGEAGEISRMSWRNWTTSCSYVIQTGENTWISFMPSHVLSGHRRGNPPMGISRNNTSHRILYSALDILPDS
jgi:hypothetical protein